MENLAGRRVVVTGGSRGLGLGMVEALLARGATVTAVARDAERLGAVAARLGVSVIAADVSEEAVAERVLSEVRPDVLVLNAAALPGMGALHELSWSDFSRSWNNDVKAGFHWIQQALRLPLAPGSRVLVSSSGAAVNGSPLSGGYAGAKRMLWLMAEYANGLSKELELGIRFQVLVPRQMIGETDHGRHAAEAYARRRGISVEAFLANFGAPISARQVGEHVATILSEERYAQGVVFGVKGDTGIVSLDAQAA